MKRSMSEKKVAIYVLITWRKTKAVKLPLEIEANVRAYHTKEEDFVDEGEPAASSTLRE